MAPETLQDDKLVCYCLKVREAEVVAAIEFDGAETLAEVGRCTGAGEGCTACHPLIRKYLKRQARSRRPAAPVPAYLASCSSPSCSVR